MSDAESIEADVKQRGITRLCHFMQSRKLVHVLTETQALLPTEELHARYPDMLDPTDRERFDGRLDCICCSVEYPNSWYFQKVQAADTLFKDWVILCLDPALVWERAALFAPRNAAAQRGRLLQPGWQGWQALFQEQIVGAGGRTFARTPHMLPCCPTDGQAEVLIPGAISHSYIKAVVVKDAQQAQREQLRLEVLGVRTAFDWRVASMLFTTEWSNIVRNGQRPTAARFP